MATRAQLIDKYAQAYVKKMLSNIKVRGEEPIIYVEDGVVTSRRFGSRKFKNEQEAYVHIYKSLFHPDLIAQG